MLTNRLVDITAEIFGLERFEIDVTAAYKALPEYEEVYVKPPEVWKAREAASGRPRGVVADEDASSWEKASGGAAG